MTTAINRNKAKQAEEQAQKVTEQKWNYVTLGIAVAIVVIVLNLLY